MDHVFLVVWTLTDLRNIAKCLSQFLRQAEASALLCGWSLRGSQPWYWAAFKGHDQVAKILLGKEGIQVDQGALVNAADKRHGKIVEMLLRRPEIRATPYNGWRPHRRISNQAARMQLPIGHSGPRRSYV